MKSTVQIFGVILCVYFIIFFALKTEVVQITPASYPSTVTSLDMSSMLTLVKQKAAYIENNSFLRPFRPERLQLVKDALNSPTLTPSQMAVQSVFLMPNSGLGMAAIRPRKCPSDTFNFQFGEGLVGWYFHYGTSTAGNSFFIYIARMELVPLKLSAARGSTTYYNIGAGIGINGAWKMLPFSICEGTYTETSEQEFSLSVKNCGSITSLVFTGSQLDIDFNISFKATDETSYRCVSSSKARRRPFFNDRYGCAPCIDGAGTTYWSIPYMETTFKLSTGGGELSPHDGTAWLDRQWLSLDTQTNFVNILSAFTTAPRGLGRYIWLNMNVTPQLQYMVTVFPTRVLSDGDVMTALINKYDERANVTWGIQGSIKINKTIEIEGAFYPAIVSVTVDSREYTLDGTSYGVCYTIDGTGNNHWTSSAVLSLGDSGANGTGFIEANQMQDQDVYLLKMLEVGGIDKKYADLFKEGGLVWRRLGPIIILVVFVLILIIVIVISV